MADHGKGDAETTPALSGHLQDTPARQTARAVIRDIVLKLDPDVIALLEDAALSPDAGGVQRSVSDALALGARPDDLADFYIPAIARAMGDRWCEDQMSFASVTIGVSRLQTMLHILGPQWRAERAISPTAPAIMLVVPEDAHHTLGAMILSGQLRRRGFSVRLVLGAKPAEIAQRVCRTTFDAVFVSAARGQTLDSLRQIIENIKTVADNPPPIVVGGSILDVQSVADILALTGADHATGKPDEALRICGLLTKEQTIANFRTGE
ncbi:MAG: cobalamin-dependent protein [Pseudomonadota bacterium]